MSRILIQKLHIKEVLLGSIKASRLYIIFYFGCENLFLSDLQTQTTLEVMHINQSGKEGLSTDYKLEGNRWYLYHK